MTQVLMRYVPADHETVARLVEVLEAQDWDVWWDPRVAEDQSLDVLFSDLDGEPLCVIAVWSRRAVRSRGLRGQAREAQKLGLLVSVRIDRVPLPLELRVRGAEAFDLARWQGEPNHPGLRGLLAAVARKLNTHADLSLVPRLSVPRRGGKGRIALNLRLALIAAALAALAFALLRYL